MVGEIPMTTDPKVTIKHTYREFFRIKATSWIPQRDKRKLRSLLLNIKDIPAERFDVRENRSWPTAMWGSDDEIISRARDVHSITVWRVMRNARSARSICLQLTPFANREDAESILPGFTGGLRGMPMAQRMEYRSVTLENITFEGLTKYVTVERSSTDSKRPVRTLFLAGVEDRFVFSVEFLSREDNTWSWDEAAHLIKLQVRKIREGAQIRD
jgi:hypothetical protein